MEFRTVLQCRGWHGAGGDPAVVGVTLSSMLGQLFISFQFKAVLQHRSWHGAGGDPAFNSGCHSKTHAGSFRHLP